MAILNSSLLDKITASGTAHSSGSIRHEEGLLNMTTAGSSFKYYVPENYIAKPIAGGFYMILLSDGLQDNNVFSTEPTFTLSVHAALPGSTNDSIQKIYLTQNTSTRYTSGWSTSESTFKLQKTSSGSIYMHNITYLLVPSVNSRSCGGYINFCPGLIELKVKTAGVMSTGYRSNILVCFDFALLKTDQTLTYN